MSKRCGSWITWATLAVAVGTAAPSHAITGTVRVTVAKAGFIVGAGGGKGVLTFRHRNYPFTVQGLSLGLTAGASINKLVGRAEYINELSDFAGTYSVMAWAAPSSAALAACNSGTTRASPSRCRVPRAASKCPPTSPRL